MNVTHRIQDLVQGLCNGRVGDDWLCHFWVEAKHYACIICVPNGLNETLLSIGAIFKRLKNSPVQVSQLRVVLGHKIDLESQILLGEISQLVRILHRLPWLHLLWLARVNVHDGIQFCLKSILLVKEGVAACWRRNVARRIAVMDRTSPDVIKEVESILEQKLASLVNQDYTIIGGVDSVVEILNSVDRGTEKHIMESLEIEEPELADEIRKKMFVFEDILLLEDRAIQRVLRDVDNNDLATALKSANEQVQNAIFNNLSKRLAVMIKEDMEFMGPVRMKDVEEAQQKIVNIIRKLEDSGEIVISRGGGDEIVV